MILFNLQAHIRVPAWYLVDLAICIPDELSYFLTFINDMKLSKTHRTECYLLCCFIEYFHLHCFQFG